MASLTRGYSFGATESVTNTKLHTLVDSATLSTVVQADITASEGLVHSGTSAPSDTDQLWVDTSLTIPLLRSYDSTNSVWVPVGQLGVLTNKSSQTGSVGRVVILDTSNSNSYKYTSTEGDTKVLGVEFASTAANSTGPIVTHGLGVPVLLEISASAGCYLRSSTATGKAVPVAGSSSGLFAIVLENGTASAKCNIFGNDANTTSVDQTASYTWTGTHSFAGIITLPTASASTTNWSPILQVVNVQDGASATTTTVFPIDDTIPQNTEGGQFLSASITPKHANNKLMIDVFLFGGENTDTSNVFGCALFQDSTANALAAGVSKGPTGTQLFPDSIHFRHYMTAGTTSSTTFKVRAGLPDAGTFRFNGADTRYMGGVMASSLTITEIKV